LKLFLCVRSDQTVHIKDISFITRLLALEVKGISTYYQEESTAHDASMDEFERLSPLPGLNLGLWRREGPLDEVEKRIALLDRHPIQRIVFRVDHYAADDGSMFLAAYATAKDPPIKLITLSELLWFRAENDVVVEFVGDAAVDVSLTDEQRKDC